MCQKPIIMSKADERFELIRSKVTGVITVIHSVLEKSHNNNLSQLR